MQMYLLRVERVRMRSVGVGCGPEFHLLHYVFYQEGVDAGGAPGTTPATLATTYRGTSLIRNRLAT